MLARPDSQQIYGGTGLALKTREFEFGRLDLNMVSTSGRAYSYLVIDASNTHVSIPK